MWIKARKPQPSGPLLRSLERFWYSQDLLVTFTYTLKSTYIGKFAFSHQMCKEARNAYMLELSTCVNVCCSKTIFGYACADSTGPHIERRYVKKLYSISIRASESSFGDIYWIWSPIIRVCELVHGSKWQLCPVAFNHDLNYVFFSSSFRAVFFFPSRPDFMT